MRRTVRELMAHLERERLEEPARIAAMLEADAKHLQDLVEHLDREREEEPERLRAMLEAERLAEARLMADVLEEVEDRARCAPGSEGEVHNDTLGEVTHGNEQDGEG